MIVIKTYAQVNPRSWPVFDTTRRTSLRQVEAVRENLIAKYEGEYQKTLETQYDRQQFVEYRHWLRIIILTLQESSVDEWKEPGE